MFKAWSICAIVMLGLATAWAAVPAEPDPAPVPAKVTGKASAFSAGTPPSAGELEPLDTTQTLNLTDLQRRILEQVFHEHAFEAPAAPAADAPLGVRVEPTAPGGLYRLGAGGDLPARLTITVGSPGAMTPVRVIYYAEDFYGRKVAEGTFPAIFPDKFGVGTAEVVLQDVAAFGYYHVIVTATSETRTATGACGLVIVHPYDEGSNPKDPFGMAAPPGKVSKDLLETCRRLGVRHLALDWIDGRLRVGPDGGAPAVQRLQDPPTLEAVIEAGLIPTAIIREDVPSEGPTAAESAEAVAAAIQKDSELIRDWQIGRRPQIGADSPAGSVAAWREAITSLTPAVRKTKAPAALWVGTSLDALVDVLTEGPTLAGLDGIALYTDANAKSPSLRSGAFQRSVDYGLATARRAGAKRAYVAETGDDPSVGSPQKQAWKLVTRHVLALATGAERVYLTWNRGSPQPLPVAAAYAWMTHLLDGAAYQANLWPEVPLTEAHLFSGAERRVAVVWSWNGDDAAKPDHGLLVFDNGSGLEALDIVGQPVGIWKDARLIVPFGEAPVYIVSGELKVDQFRDRISKARILGIAPATLRIGSLLRGTPPGRVNLDLYVQSHRPYRQDGMAGLLLPTGWKARQVKTKFGLDGGYAQRFAFECDTTAEGGAPPFSLQAGATLNEELTRRVEKVWPAQAPRRTIEVGYGLADWEGIEPVVVQNESGDVRAEVRTAWDSEFFYVAAAVRRTRATFKTGRYACEGDAIQLAWGLADRADDDFGRKSRGVAMPSGAFRDTDHLIALTATKDGAQALRLRQPRVAFRDHVPGNQDPWFGPVPGAQADIARDRDNPVTIFEAAIPFKALAPLRGESGRVFRFALRIGDGDRPPLEWAREAGVPDYLAGPGSFLPVSYVDGLPCQTFWSLVGPVPGGQPPAPK